MSRGEERRYPIIYGFDESHVLPFWEISDEQLTRLLNHAQTKTTLIPILPSDLERENGDWDVVEDLDLVVGTAGGDVVRVELDSENGYSLVAKLKRIDDQTVKFLIWFEEEGGEVLSRGMILPASCIHLLKRRFLYPSGNPRNFVTVARLSVEENRDENDWEVILPMETEGGLELFRFGMKSIAVR